MTARKSKRAVLLVLTLGVVVFASATAVIYSGDALSEKGRSTHGAAGPDDKITLAYVNTTHAVLAGVALHKGYYRQEGLEVTARPHPFGKSALDDVLAGNADFAAVADPPIMMAAMEGEQVCVIATIQTSNQDNAIVARKEAGILHPGDLKGKRVAATLGTTSDFFLETFLIARGIAVEDVDKIDLSPIEMQDALLNGAVDAASAFQPFLIRIQKKFGDSAISFYDKNIYRWTFSVVGRHEIIRRKPEAVKKLLRALIRAEAFVAGSPAEAQKIVSDYSKMDIDLVREIWPGMRFQVTLDQFLVLALEDESRWAINSGMVKKREIPNFLDFIYFEGLESVRPKSVRVLGRNVAGE